MKSRNIFFDILKGLAILLVVIGHSIQNLHPEGMDNRIALFIYSFHMPLFITISGLFVINAIDKRSVAEFVKNRFYRLMLPSLSFGFIIGAMLLLNCYRDTREVNLPLFFTTWANGLWFLRVLFILSVLACVFRKVFGGKMIIGWLMFLLVLYFMPATRFFNELKFLSPFFALSILAVAKWPIDSFAIPNWLIISCTILFFSIFPYFDFSKTMYRMSVDYHSSTYHSDYFFRLAIGLLGIIMTVGFCKATISLSKLKLSTSSRCVYDKTIAFLGSLGFLTLPIYVVHERFLILTHIAHFKTSSFLLITLISGLLILLSLFCFNLISKSHLLGLLLFGNPRKPEQTRAS